MRVGAKLCLCVYVNVWMCTVCVNLCMRISQYCSYQQVWSYFTSFSAEKAGMVNHLRQQQQNINKMNEQTKT